MVRTQAGAYSVTPELRRTSTVVVLGSIMSVLDTTIVAVALATLGRDFHVSVTTIQWVATGYLLALAMVIRGGGGYEEGGGGGGGGGDGPDHGSHHRRPHRVELQLALDLLH